MRTRSLCPTDERIGAGKGASVHGEQVEIAHHVGVGPTGARLHVPFVQHDGDVPVDGIRVAARMDDEHPREAHRDLGHLVVVGVVHERAVLGERKLVDERLAGRDDGLAQSADAVHARGQEDPVPVHRRRRAQAVGDVDADAVALDAFERGAVYLAVVAPARRRQAGRELVLDLFDDVLVDPRAVGGLASGDRRAVGRVDTRRPLADDRRRQIGRRSEQPASRRTGAAVTRRARASGGFVPRNGQRGGAADRSERGSAKGESGSGEPVAARKVGHRDRGYSRIGAIGTASGRDRPWERCWGRSPPSHPSRGRAGDR